MGRATKLKTLHVYLSEDMQKVVMARAKNKGFRVMADYVRQLIEDDINADSDRHISLEIKRGKPPKSKGVASS